MAGLLVGTVLLPFRLVLWAVKAVSLMGGLAFGLVIILVVLAFLGGMADQLGLMEFLR